MNCEQAVELIQRQLDGDLSEIEATQLHHHLAHCPSCLKEHEAYQKLDQALNQLPKVQPDRSVVDQLNQESLRGDHNIKVKISTFFTKGKWIAGTVAALVLLSAAIIWGGTKEPSASSELSMAQEAATDNSVEILEAAPDENIAILNQVEEGLKSGELPENLEHEAVNQLLEDETEDPEYVGLREGTRYLSPDGTYLAYIGPDGEDIRLDQKVNGEYQPHYIAINPQGKEWRVMEMRWVSAHELYYVLYHLQTEEEQYWLIDAPERQEQQLDNPYETGINSTESE